MNNRDITKMSKFVHNDDNDDNDDAKAIAMPRVFSENSRASKMDGLPKQNCLFLMFLRKNLENKTKNFLKNGW